jgi:hypothetical protein
VVLDRGDLRIAVNIAKLAELLRDSPQLSEA